MRTDDLFADTASRAEVLSVRQLNLRVRRALEKSFPLLWVAGEISNFSRAASGHWYFSLKDQDAQARCVMFRNRSQYLEWIPADGMAVEAQALVTLYEPKGDYQLIVETLRLAGFGALYEKFARLKARLALEGLFDDTRKKPLPAFPKRIGVITSAEAAALRDVLAVLKRRAPHVCVILYPAPVQGETAAATLAHALLTASARGECDALILCRGGGSIEDLWAFNEERVARAIAASAVPVITGIGHETDFTIADFVADARAPTPTAAAQLASPDHAELLARLTRERARLQRAHDRNLQSKMQHLDQLSKRLTHPGAKLLQQASQLAHLRARLHGSWHKIFDTRLWRLRSLGNEIKLHRPEIDSLRRQQLQYSERLARATALALSRRSDRLQALGSS
jgi:exodeoxyribonuclease VII large subunit